MREFYVRLALIPLLASTVQFAAAQLYCSPGVFLSGRDPTATVAVADIHGANVKFKCGCRPRGEGYT
jgi:hypothetical protein